MIIAVSGKGGTGKTMVSALLIKAIAEKDSYDILAIDSDPDSNLPEALGVEVEKTIGDIREELLEEREKLPPGMSWQQKLEYEAMDALVETDAFDLLSMGRPEGPGCYCSANHVLREIVDTMAKNYDIVVIDTEAGLEHLSRRTTQNVDTMLVVTDTSKRGITTAARIKELAGELKINFSRLNVIINRATPEVEGKLQDYVKEIGLEVAGIIPEDEMVRKFDVEGVPLTQLPEESKAYRAIKKIVEKLELR